MPLVAVLQVPTELAESAAKLVFLQSEFRWEPAPSVRTAEMRAAVQLLVEPAVFLLGPASVGQGELQKTGQTEVQAGRLQSKVLCRLLLSTVCRHAAGPRACGRPMAAAVDFRLVWAASVGPEVMVPKGEA